ncbi:PREDICTED: uncharacterized protein LOC106115969 [Papilio xuthus]|uniref:Uncharacterized protein LOC106115969 n=1 Tax=Papilio xuthus TaxID=66420 RepID=A0AAJ6Z496_PAPXU|nr:PREDICTED: uncharacterized protein LOC106115969 [Papilio xuthus]
MNYVTEHSINMKIHLSLLLVFVLLSSCYGNKTDDSDTYLSHFIADLWLEGTDVLKIIWRDCSKKLVDVKDGVDRKEYFPKFLRCLKRKTLRALDRCLSSDIVPIADGVNLVRFELVDGSGNTMPINSTSPWTDKELEAGEWRTLALKRIAKILRTHVVKFDFDDSNIFDKVESRGRRRHHLMTMMMFGIVSIGMVLVPMGFQFLAVLGGKALVLAKMALILASIQGLKKIASSPLNYGFYHTYPYEHYERRSLDNLPLTNIVPTIIQKEIASPWAKSEHIKLDELKQYKEQSEDNIIDVIQSTNNIKEEQNSEAKVFPIYPGTQAGELNLDVSNPVVDLSARPGEVQADYALELPYNRLRFQSPTSVVSS